MASIAYWCSSAAECSLERPCYSVEWEFMIGSRPRSAQAVRTFVAFYVDGCGDEHMHDVQFLINRSGYEMYVVRRRCSSSLLQQIMTATVLCHQCCQLCSPRDDSGDFTVVTFSIKTMTEWKTKFLPLFNLMLMIALTKLLTVIDAKTIRINRWESAPCY